MRNTSYTLALLFLLAASSVFAAIFGTIKGVVHDAQHRPVPGALVTVTARDADWTQTTSSDANGAFQIQAVPIGDYTVTVSLSGFAASKEAVTVLADTAPVLHIQLEVAPLSTVVTVSAPPETASTDSATPTTLVDRRDVEATPGADRTNALTAITDFVPGAYVTHDQLHIRGGHQVSWLIDGVPVPNTNIASNVGPQFDPKDVDVLEVQRGSYEAQYGDRTYGVLNVVPRTGFERNNDAELIVSAGNFTQTNDEASAGGHSQRSAYFVSVNGNRSNLGLGTPVADVMHDREGGASGFGSFIWNASRSNQLRLVTSLRHDSYQIPNGPDEAAAGIDDVERETDAFVNASWVRSFASRALVTVSPFYHSNSANYDGGARDPIVTVDEHRSQYAGAQATASIEAAKNKVEVGFYGFHQQDDQLFAVTFNDASNPNLATRDQPAGALAAVFAEDKVSVASWLTLTAGVRQTHFSGSITENATSPRVGASVQKPGSGVVLRGFYGRFYQAPPLVTASGPLLGFVTTQNLGFIPLHGERDREYQVGLTVPIKHWLFDVDRFHTRAANYFDHNPVGNSNVFFPITIDGALIRGTEVTVRSPRVWARAQVHLAYSYQTAEGQGAISGGLTDCAPGEGYFLLDHDQRHTLSVGANAQAPHGFTASANISYGSGFLDGDNPPAHLPGHTTIDVTVGKSVGKKLSVSVTALNAANNHVLVDNSLTFGGMHFNNPREIYATVRYRFHY